MHFPLVLINGLNKTESAVFLILNLLSISEGSVFPDYFTPSTPKSNRGA